MHLDDGFLDAVLGMPGVVGLAVLEDRVVADVLEIEGSIGTVSGGMRLEVPGLERCAGMENVLALSCDSRFPRPSEPTILMLDREGGVVGHDVPAGSRDGYGEGDDLIWLSDTFVMYASMVSRGEVRMVMLSSRVRVPGFSEGVRAELFYPSVCSAEYLNRACGFSGDRLSTVVMGISPMGDRSVPVADVVQVPGGGRSHREPASEDALDRRDLVGERFQVPQAPLADEDLHALVMVQVDVDGCVDKGLVLVLKVGELVSDGAHRVIVDHDYGADHPLVLVLPLVLRQGVADQVADRLRSADVTLLGYRLVEGLQKLWLQGDTDACYSIHVRGYRGGR